MVPAIARPQNRALRSSLCGIAHAFLATREAYVGSAVLEIARLREELGAALRG